MSFSVSRNGVFDSVNSTSISCINVNAAEINQVQAISGTVNTTLNIAGGFVTIPVNTSGGPLTITLPAQQAGQHYHFLLQNQ
jgi:hypothetical protein